MLVDHLDDEIALEDSKRTDISWKVAAGTIAYPSQNQIFYESVNGNGMWFDSVVYRVERTIDRRNIWGKRHYHVRDGPIPGTFRFSVMDNGVTTNEFWPIVNVADDLSYMIFHLLAQPGLLDRDTSEVWCARQTVHCLLKDHEFFVGNMFPGEMVKAHDLYCCISMYFQR